MRNPWRQVPETEPFVLDIERDIIETYNATCSNPAKRFQLNVLPEPFIGNPGASVVLLNLNPGYDNTDPEWHSRESFAASILANLSHELKEYPFYPLNPDFAESGVAQWWIKNLRWFIQASSREQVANNLFCIEWLPYHSLSGPTVPKWMAGNLLPSQRYAIALVMAAIERGARIVVMRKYKDWVEHVPILKNYSRLHLLNNWQRPWLSEGNIQGYSLVVEALREHDT